MQPGLRVSSDLTRFAQCLADLALEALGWQPVAVQQQKGEPVV